MQWCSSIGHSAAIPDHVSPSGLAASWPTRRQRPKKSVPGGVWEGGARPFHLAAELLLSSELCLTNSCWSRQHAFRRPKRPLCARTVLKTLCPRNGPQAWPTTAWACDTSRPIRERHRGCPFSFCRLSLQSPWPLSLGEDLIQWDRTRLRANKSRGEADCQGALGSSPLTDWLPLRSCGVPSQPGGPTNCPLDESYPEEVSLTYHKNVLTQAILFSSCYLNEDLLHTLTKS